MPNSLDSNPSTIGQAMDQSKLENLTTQKSSRKLSLEVPNLSLPNGGGAVRSIDDKFQVNTSNGTASFTIALPISKGRQGFQPRLSLNYNSGGGNSPYGLGWNINLSSIQIKSDKKIPQYLGGDQDEYMITGMEDLVPYLAEDTSGKWTPKQEIVSGVRVCRYRPRVEGAFQRIEKIDHPTKGVYWKVTSGDNIATFYGSQKITRLSNPVHDRQIFRWLPEFTYDDKGNWMSYEYKHEDSDNVPASLHEKNRLNSRAAYANIYLKRIKYGNRVAFYPDQTKPYEVPTPTNSEHFFELVLDYGDHDQSIPHPKVKPGQLWNYRPDSFSSFRAGFEIRTQRLCNRVLMFHHFKDEVGFGTDLLVRSLDFEYSDSNINNSGLAETTYLSKITESGYIRKNDGSYSMKSLPPLTFDYQELEWNTTIKPVSPNAITNVPTGLGAETHWVDLYGEGVSGLLIEQGDELYYKSNAGTDDNDDPYFARIQPISTRPSYRGFQQGNLILQDLEANGEKQFVVEQEDMHGYFELNDESWNNFLPFEQFPDLNLTDPSIRRIDLDGDGRAELVIARQSIFIWYPSKGKKGFSKPYQIAKDWDEEEGPSILFTGADQRIFMADMTGDGLTDIVRITNGEISYWANMGYGRFSAKITMSHAPVFDHPDLFDPGKLLLADVSGTGTTDIVYLDRTTIRSWLNLAGNSWSTGFSINPSFTLNDLTKIDIIDLKGNGTLCLVWSSRLPDHSNTPMKYMDLMNGRKPHLLARLDNHMGKILNIEYKSSSHYYLDDKRKGQPWITKLPFPVQVVSKTILEEKVTDVRFSTTYSYHHGYYDHEEKEFRGFGRIDQLDSEFYPEWKLNTSSNGIERSEALFQKPVLTKTWYHTGAFIDKEKTLTHFESEYWYQLYNRQFPTHPLNVTEFVLPDATFTASNAITDSRILNKLSPEERREAIRACKGMVLRQEIFAFDAPDENPTIEELQLQAKPFSVSTHNCQIQLLQPRSDTRHPVFFPAENEAISFHYERDETDPRISHSLNVVIDPYGNVLEKATIVYGRQAAKADSENLSLKAQVTDFSGSAEQSKLQTAFNINMDATRSVQTISSIHYVQYFYSSFNDGNSEFLIVDLPHAYRHRKLTEQKSFELTGFPMSGPKYSVEDFIKVPFSTVSSIDFHDTPYGSPQRRLIEQMRVRFYKDDLSGSLPLGRIETRAIPYEIYQLAFTPDTLSKLFVDKNGTDLKVNNKKIDSFMNDPGNFVTQDGNYWIRSGISHRLNPQYNESVLDAKKRFFSPVQYEDATGSSVKISYDSETFTSAGKNKNDGYYLFTKSTEDELKNRISIDRFDFRVLKPARLIDVNTNPSSVLFDELGRVKAIALEGNHYTDSNGQIHIDAADHLQGLSSEETMAETASFQALVNAATTQEMNVHAILLLKGASTRFIYDLDTFDSDGSPVRIVTINREEHHSVNPTSAVQLSFSYLNGLGETIMIKKPTDPGVAKYMESGILKSKNTFPELRWIGTGRTIFNNKGNPVKQYEPYFSTNIHYEKDDELIYSGVTPVFYYDALGRKIKTEFPDGTLSTIQYSPWRQDFFDQNDLILQSKWYDDRINRNIDATLNGLNIDPVLEATAASQTETHFNTPTTMLLDRFGRPVLHIAHNGKDANLKDKLFTTFISMDIEGNALEVIDARGNSVMKYGYNLMGQRLVQDSSDSGRRTTFSNALEKPVFIWDGKNHIHHFTYDKLQRVTEVKVTGGSPGSLDHTFQKVIYGEGSSDELKYNRRMQVFHIYDTAGKTTHTSFDFKGNLLLQQRSLIQDYKSIVNWKISNPDSLLASNFGPYSSIFTYDALGRMISSTSPDSSQTEYFYNPGNLLKQVLLTSPGQSKVKHIDDIEYNAKDQRISVLLGNGVLTRYHYDPLTFKLRRLDCIKGTGEVLQDLNYSYDPAGNITCIYDKSIPDQYFAGSRIQGKKSYLYDPLYRLTEAQGREHAGQQINFTTKDNHDDLPFIKTYASGDVMAWRNFTQIYDYDPTGNILKMDHQVSGSGNATHHWTRTNSYHGSNNRMTSTQIKGKSFSLSHDSDHGYINKLPHLSVMKFNFKDELVESARQVVNTGTPETTYYVYDGTGQRVRKVTEDQNGTIKEQRIYIGDVEFYKKESGTHGGLERTSYHLMDGEQRVALIETRNGINDGSLAHVVRYQLSDQLGSSILEVDGSARVISYEEYHPYGTTAYQATSSQIQVARRRYRYTGMERDEETGLGYHTARYYMPWLGRWLSPDPVGISAGINLFAYVSGKVITHRDTFGKNAKPDQQLDLDRLLAEQEHYVAGWLRAYAVEKVSKKELDRLDPDEGETTKKYYRSSNTVVLEHSGRKSSDSAPYHCTDYVMNTMYKSGLRPIAGGYGSKLDKGKWAAYYKPTKKVYAEMKNLEKLELAKEVDIDPATPLANVKPGDIMVTAKGETWGHHVLIVDIDTNTNEVITREAGTSVKSKRRTIDTSKWKVYRLTDVDPEEFKELYENNEDFRDFIHEKYEEFEKIENDIIRKLNTAPVRPTDGDSNEPYVYPDVNYWLPPVPGVIPPVSPEIPGRVTP